MAPHAVIFSMDGPGHLNPMMELARRLEEQHQFSITVLLSEATMASRGRSLIRDHPTARFVRVPTPLEFVGDQARKMEAPAEEIIMHLDPPATVFIADGFAEWTQDVANRLGIPRAYFWAATAAAEVICSHIPELKARGYLHDRNVNDEITFLPGLPRLHRTDLPISFFDPHAAVDVLGAACQRRPPEAHCALVNSFDGLEPEVFAAMHKRIRFFGVGPLVSPALLGDKPLSRDDLGGDEMIGCLEWLDKQAPRSVLYMAFGSLATLSLAQIEQIIEALEVSKQGFLWSFRPNFADDSSDEKVMGDLLERAKAMEFGKVVSWTPQIHVLRHPSLVGFVTHCGWNSTVEGICSGLPMLAWPCTAEQNINSKLMVEKWRIALEVNDHGKNLAKLVEADKIIKLIKDLNGEPGKLLKENALALRGALRQAHSLHGSASKSLADFVNSL